jgi:hypothetical protein
VFDVTEKKIEAFLRIYRNLCHEYGLKISSEFEHSMFIEFGLDNLEEEINVLRDEALRDLKKFLETN